jgi:hypothetical protein
MVHPDHRDQHNSQDPVTINLKDHHPKSQVIMPPPHKDQVIMVPLLKDQITMDSKNLIMEVVDQLLVLAPLKTPDQTTTMDHPNLLQSPNNNLAQLVCSRCCLPLI